jgi:hypothetical protein
MRRTRAEKGKHDQPRQIVRAEAEKALLAEPELKGSRKKTKLAQKIHRAVNDQLRGIYENKNPDAEYMTVDTIRKQLENL